MHEHTWVSHEGWGLLLGVGLDHGLHLRAESGAQHVEVGGSLGWSRLAARGILFTQPALCCGSGTLGLTDAWEVVSGCTGSRLVSPGRAKLTTGWLRGRRL